MQLAHNTTWKSQPGEAPGSGGQCEGERYFDKTSTKVTGLQLSSHTCKEAARELGGCGLLPRVLETGPLKSHVRNCTRFLDSSLPLFCHTQSVTKTVHLVLDGDLNVMGT